MIFGKALCIIISIRIFRNNNREYENKKFDLRARKDIFSVDDLPQVNFCSIHRARKMRYLTKIACVFNLDDLRKVAVAERN